MTSIQRTKFWPSDWPEAADVVFQSEPHIDYSRHDRARIATEAVEHITALGSLVEQLLAERAHWAGVALDHGATLGDVSMAMGVGTSTDGPQSHAREINWLGRGVEPPRRGDHRAVDPMSRMRLWFLCWQLWRLRGRFERLHNLRGGDRHAT